MQSQLEAALLGLGGSFYANLFEDRKRHQEDAEVDDADATEEVFRLSALILTCVT